MRRWLGRWLSPMVNWFVSGSFGVGNVSVVGVGCGVGCGCRRRRPKVLRVACGRAGGGDIHHVQLVFFKFCY